MKVETAGGFLAAMVALNEGPGFSPWYALAELSRGVPWTLAVRMYLTLAESREVSEGVLGPAASIGKFPMGGECREVVVGVLRHWFFEQQHSPVVPENSWNVQEMVAESFVSMLEEVVGKATISRITLSSLDPRLVESLLFTRKERSWLLHFGPAELREPFRA